MAEVLGFGATQDDWRTFWKGNNMNDNATNINYDNNDDADYHHGYDDDDNDDGDNEW